MCGVVGYVGAQNSMPYMIGGFKKLAGRACGAFVVAIPAEGGKAKVTKVADKVILVPQISNFLQPILHVVPLQFLAYWIAKRLGCNIDQPRNLAKSVTVE